MNYEIAQIEKESREKRKIFQSVLKKANNAKVIRQLPALHESAFSNINCLDCANCCKNYSPRFKMPDIKRISRHLRMKESDFILQYLHIDDEGDYVVRTHPCPFLNEGNDCSIYEVRPRDCARYPYTDEDVLVKQAGLTLKNSEICPAVSSVLDQLSSILQ